MKPCSFCLKVSDSWRFFCVESIAHVKNGQKHLNGDAIVVFRQHTSIFWLLCNVSCVFHRMTWGWPSIMYTESWHHHTSITDSYNVVRPSRSSKYNASSLENTNVLKSAGPSFLWLIFHYNSSGIVQRYIKSNLYLLVALKKIANYDVTFTFTVVHQRRFVGPVYKPTVHKGLFEVGSWSNVLSLSYYACFWTSRGPTILKKFIAGRKETVPRNSYFWQPFVDGASLKLTKPTTHEFHLHTTSNKTVIAQLNQVLIWLDSMQFVAYVSTLVLTHSVQLEVGKCDKTIRGQV